jgi:hypothetical protein
MISCRTQYKSYTDENTHIHVLSPQEPIGSGAHLAYVREVRHRGARLKGEKYNRSLSHRHGRGEWPLTPRTLK